MRAFALGMLVAVAVAAPASVSLVVPATAAARAHASVPPGNSGADQYVENVPTAKGNRPADAIAPSGSGGSGGSGGSSGSSGASGFSGASSLPPSTRAALVRNGIDGRRAAALAGATSPRTAGGSGGGGIGVGAAGAGAGSSPTGMVLSALTGGATHGGLGPLLPVILILSALGAGALSLRRRRRAAD